MIMSARPAATSGAYLSISASVASTLEEARAITAGTFRKQPDNAAMDDPSMPPELYDRGYWSNLADPGFPFIIVHRLRDEIPACHTLGVKGWRVETFPNYAPQFPSMYVAAKLMWNHQTDVDALLKDCYAKFFGPAAAPMA